MTPQHTQRSWRSVRLRNDLEAGSFQAAACTSPLNPAACVPVWSRIEKLYIGSMDPKAGACGSVFNIPQEKKLNHFVEIETGVMQAECSGIIRDFFKQLRKNKAEEKHQ